MAYINGNEVLFSAQFSGLVAIDSEMSDTSENPVENKVVKEYVDEKTTPATSETYGTVKVADDKDMASLVYGIYPNENNGVLTIAPATTDAIDARFNDCTPIVPANLEYAVKSVGDGYYAKVGEVGGEKEYELINTITVTPDTDGTLPQHIVFSTDSEGNPFELTDFYVHMYAGFVDGSKSGLYVYVNRDVGIFGNVQVGFDANKHRGCIVYSNRLNNGFLQFGVTSSSYNDETWNFQMGATKTMPIPPANAAGLMPVYKVDLMTWTGDVQAWTEGSILRLYGVRK